MVPVDAGSSPAPIDRALLERIRSRFVAVPPFESAEILEDDKLSLRVELSDDYVPDETTAHIDIRWYRNDDFTVHYQEERRDSTWACRWDRHPNTHNLRDHFHPPPDASRTDAADALLPDDHREVCRIVLDRVEKRIETLWEQR